MGTALVIGAASGIGKGLADAMDNLGFKVLRADIAFTKENQDSAAQYVDATDNRSIENLVKFFSQQHNALDCFIITIGAIDEGQVIDYPDKNLSWMIDINVLAPYRLVQQFIPLLRNSNSPKILLAGSAAGLGAFDDTFNLMPYIVSKHALMGYFKALRYDLTKTGIQVSILLPNRVKGKLSENSNAMRQVFLNEKSNFAKGNQQANTHLVEPEEIATEVIANFLAGKTYISNNPQMIIDKLEAELLAIRKDLLDK